MTIRMISGPVLAVGLLLLASCGGGGGGGTQMSATDLQSFDRHEAYDQLAETANMFRASNEPANRNPTENTGFIGGVNIRPLLLQITRNCGTTSCYPAEFHASHSGVEIGATRVRDGVSSSDLLRHLQAEANHRAGQILRWGNTPPTIRLVAGTTSDDRFEIKQAMQMVNSALPASWQLCFDKTPAPRRRSLQRGVIRVGFVPWQEWDVTGCDGAAACAWSDPVGSDGRVTLGAAIVDPSVRGDRLRVFVLLHEILHTLGRGHVDPAAFPNTIMHAAGDMGQGDSLLLNSLDVAALHAVHSRLSPGTRTDQLNHATLGPWSDISTHVFGRIGYNPGELDSVFFGAAWQNRNVRPYAIALDPSSQLQQGLGTARWSGRMIGLTPRVEPVAGATDMAVDLSDERGTIDFTSMEMWAAHSGPGPSAREPNGEMATSTTASQSTARCSTRPEESRAR